MSASEATTVPPDVAARVVKAVAPRAGDVRVQDVRIGLAYTAVRLADGRVGVAYTFRDSVRGCCSARPGGESLAGRPAAQLLPLLASEDPIEAAVGLATANAITNGNPAGPVLEGDVLEHLDIGQDDDVGMVGHFEPLVAPLERRAHSLTVFERVEEAAGRVRPAREAHAGLPRCHVALITATSLLNRTLGGLLQASESCRQVALLGASTPLVPEAFEDTPVTVLSGVVIERPDDVLRVVSEGGGMRQFRGLIRKVGLRVV